MLYQLMTLISGGIKINTESTPRLGDGIFTQTVTSRTGLLSKSMSTVNIKVDNMILTLNLKYANFCFSTRSSPNIMVFQSGSCLKNAMVPVTAFLDIVLLFPFLLMYRSSHSLPNSCSAEITCVSVAMLTSTRPGLSQTLVSSRSRFAN